MAPGYAYPPCSTDLSHLHEEVRSRNGFDEGVPQITPFESAAAESGEVAKVHGDRDALNALAELNNLCSDFSTVDSEGLRNLLSVLVPMLAHCYEKMNEQAVGN